MSLIILLLSAGFLAFVNGANDNFKGVATLFGSGTTNYKTAINWATITTFIGSVAAMFLAEELVKNFSGKGLVPDEFLLTPSFAISVALGAAITVYIATLIGMPVSTTHSLVGALLGGGIIATGGGSFNFKQLADVFLIPLIVSPAIAAISSICIYYLLSKVKFFDIFSKEKCFCIGDKYYPAKENFHPGGALNMEMGKEISLDFTDNIECVERYSGRVLGIEMQKILNGLHFISAGIVSFARGLNDTPKIVGLIIFIEAMEIRFGLLWIALAIMVGGLLKAKKVGETVGNKITPMSAGQGFTANLVTGILVTTASLHGLPVSTTHVSVGAIFGIGILSGKSNKKVINNIVGSWVLTLPVSALLSATTFLFLTSLL